MNSNLRNMEFIKFISDDATIWFVFIWKKQTKKKQEMDADVTMLMGS